jgi:formate dehydrogenase subunit gamma
MQWTNIIHAGSALLFVALSLGHIYLGTIGMEGAYETMRHGVADEAWAKEHHEYWYRETVAKRGRVPAGGVSSAPASPVKEGWKA